MWAPLPIGITDPVQRLATVSSSMADVKESGQAVGAQVLTSLSGFAPPTIVSQAARLQARQRFLNLVVTNVPGPQFPLYLLGQELEAIYPMVPLAKNTALGIAILSYNGQLNFGLSADYDAVADLDDSRPRPRSRSSRARRRRPASRVPPRRGRARARSARPRSAPRSDARRAGRDPAGIARPLARTDRAPVRLLRGPRPRHAEWRVRHPGDRIP